MKHWFQISSMEEKGFWLLNVIILLLVLNNIFQPFDTLQAKTESHPELETQFLEFIAAQNALEKKTEKSFTKHKTPNAKKVTKVKTEVPQLFEFNPNTASKETLVKLGFKPYQARNVVKYREAGGTFRNPGDLVKIYGMEADLLKKIQPFARIPDAPKKEVKIRKEEKKLAEVNINAADTTILKSLRGIGPYFAKKIVEYRDQLGGFVDTLQLIEIWRLDSTLFEENPGSIVLGNNTIKRVNLNVVTREDLARHPYLSWKQANNIIAYREQHGEYQSVDEITQTVLIGDEDYVKIAPYLTVD